MRSLVRMPDGMCMYPCYLRDAGYYCTNNSKQDYNLELTGEVWDESSRNAHWNNRQAGQPFFAIFNITSSHEGKVNNPQTELVHDPDRAPLPAYHPDTPETRQDWAQFYSNATAMDREIGQRLDEIEAAGLVDDTIVFFYGDHGAGLPRHKRFAFDSGLHVGLMVYVPERFRDLAPADYGTGKISRRLASFVDLGPTALSLAGVKPPEHMQGHALMGKYEASAQPYLYGFRGRTDERYDNVRTVRDERYVYIRHFMPQRPYGQHVAVMFMSQTAQAWKKLFDEGKLPPHQAAFWQTKPSEELYDLQKDPDEVCNLIDSPATPGNSRTDASGPASVAARHPRRRYAAGRRDPRSLGKQLALQHGTRQNTIRFGNDSGDGQFGHQRSSGRCRRTPRSPGEFRQCCALLGAR